MYARIDIDVLESIISTYSKRDNVQTRLYGVLMGVYEGENGVHIKNCIFGILSETEAKELSNNESLATTKVTRLTIY